MVERVVGPIRGYYIASYACAMGEPGERYLGFAKLCIAQPQDYWQAKACAKFSGDDPVDCPEKALDRAEERARMQIHNLPRLW